MWVFRFVKCMAKKWFLILRAIFSKIAFAVRFKVNSVSLADNRFVCRWEDRLPCLHDATGETGFDAHYIYHPAWAIRKILEANPKKHVDISSKLDFVTMLSAFLPVEFYDYRPADISLAGLRCCHADLISLPFESNSIKSLSCMHVIEHIGLERYGDPFDPQGDLKAMRELIRVLAPGGIYTLLYHWARSRASNTMLTEFIHMNRYCPLLLRFHLKSLLLSRTKVSS